MKSSDPGDDVSMSQNTEDEKTMLSETAPSDKINDLYTPIKALSTFNYDWRIKARCIKKYDRKCWKNARSEGYLLNIDLMDMYGTQI